MVGLPNDLASTIRRSSQLHHHLHGRERTRKYMYYERDERACVRGQGQACARARARRSRAERRLLNMVRRHRLLVEQAGRARSGRTSTTIRITNISMRKPTGGWGGGGRACADEIRSSAQNRYALSEQCRLVSRPATGPPCVRRTRLALDTMAISAAATPAHLSSPQRARLSHRVRRHISIVATCGISVCQCDAACVRVRRTKEVQAHIRYVWVFVCSYMVEAHAQRLP